MVHWDMGLTSSVGWPAMVVSWRAAGSVVARKDVIPPYGGRMSYLHTDVGEADEGTHGIPGTRTPMGETAKEYARLTRERIESWPRWIRTTIPRSKVWCPAVGRGASGVAAS